MEKLNEIRLDNQTVIRIGYDECEINDGVVPDTVLLSGVINKYNDETNEVKEISYVVLHIKE